MDRSKTHNYRELPYRVSGDVNRYDHRQEKDDYKQAGDLFRLMTVPEKKALISNLAEALAITVGDPERASVK